MKLIVGLGNPGSGYSKTRHNFGRLVVESLARSEGCRFTVRKKLKASVASFEEDENAITLAYPEVFMNVSGKAVENLVRYYPVNPRKDLLIVVDDLALPFGALRLRGRGSDGGHNGLKSVSEELGTMDFARLRLGIGHPGNLIQKGMADVFISRYVLSPFSREEKKKLTDFLAKGGEACRLWTGHSLEEAMNVVNS